LQWFYELAAARPATGFGIAPIPYSEIRAWAELLELSPAPFEVRVLRALDSKLIEVMRG
jgi:hypothetical protein